MSPNYSPPTPPPPERIPQNDYYFERNKKPPPPPRPPRRDAPTKKTCAPRAAARAHPSTPPRKALGTIDPNIPIATPSKSRAHFGVPLALAFVEEKKSTPAPPRAPPAPPPPPSSASRVKAAILFLVACHFAHVRRTRSRRVAPRPPPVMMIAPPGPNYVVLPGAAGAPAPEIASIPRNPAIDFRHAYATDLSCCVAATAAPRPLAPPVVFAEYDAAPPAAKPTAKPTAVPVESADAAPADVERVDAAAAAAVGNRRRRVTRVAAAAFRAAVAPFRREGFVCVTPFACD